MGFEKKLAEKDFEEMRRLLRELPTDVSFEERARRIAHHYPGISVKTLEDYARLCIRSTDKVFGLYMAGTVKIGVLVELNSWDPAEQDYIIDEYVSKGMMPEQLRRVRRYRKENGWGFEECIAKAMGKMPVYTPTKHEPQRRSLDSLLSDIADKGARWRAMVSQALEMIDGEAAAAGIHEAIFTKVFLLRQIVGEQYDFVNGRVNKYMTVIKRRLQNGGMSAEGTAVTEEGDADAPHHAEEAAEGHAAQGLDGRPVPDPAGESPAP